MKNCMHCGKEMDDGTRFCTACGKPAQMEDGQEIAQEKEQKKKPVKIVAAIAAVVIVFVVVAMGVKSGGQLNEYDMIAYEDCLTLKENLKDPDSFKLYSDIVMVKWWDSLIGDECNYVFIEYGGTNSYGAIIKSTAIFDGKLYIIDSEDDGANIREIWAKTIWKEYKNGWKAIEKADAEYDYEYVEINTDKVKKKLGLE